MASVGGMTATAIAGLGMTEMGKVYGRTATDFAAEALALALDDAGLDKDDVDGLLINANHSAEMAPMLQMSLGLEDLTLVSAMSAYGSSAGAMLQYATYAIDDGPGERRRLPVRRRAAGGGRLDLAVGLQRPRDRRPDGLCEPAPRLRRLRAGEHELRARVPAPHAPLRHDARPARDDRGRPARVGAAEPGRADARQADDARRLPRLALDRRAAAPARLLPGLQRRRRRDRHRRPSARATCASRRSTCSASARPGPATTSAPGASRPSTRAPGAPASSRCAWPASRSPTSTCSSSTTATRTPSSSRSRTTASARRAKAARSSPTASSGPAARCRRTPAAASSRRSTCGASRRSSEGVIQARGQGGARQVPKHDLVLVSGNGGMLNWHSTTILAA